VLVGLKKSDCPWLYDVSAHIGQSALKDLNVAFDRFFKGLGGGGSPLVEDVLRLRRDQRHSQPDRARLRLRRLRPHRRPRRERRNQPTQARACTATRGSRGSDACGEEGSGARSGERETGLGEAGSDSERHSPFDSQKHAERHAGVGLKRDESSHRESAPPRDKDRPWQRRSISAPIASRSRLLYEERGRKFAYVRETWLWGG
jgi:hypothetical protein